MSVTLVGTMVGDRISEVPALIVGAGPVGLSTALLLARRGVRSTVVERRQTTSSLPKARLVNTRSMEVFRQCGIESLIRAAGLPPSKARFLIRARSVAGEEINRREATFTQGAQALHSPTTRALARRITWSRWCCPLYATATLPRFCSSTS